MSRLRLLLLIAGAGTLFAGLPAGAAVRATPDPTPTGAAAGESRALELLTSAARAARTRTYTGTQYVSTWRVDTARSEVADIRHTAGAGSVVRVRPTAGGDSNTSTTLATDLDLRLLRLLAEHYVLAVASDATCTGREAHVVEARRPGADGPGAVAGRFWIDAASALVLRREVFDRAGRLVRSSAFATLTVDPAPVPDVAPVASVTNDRLSDGELDRLRADGWQIPSALPGDLELFDARARMRDGQRVLHLSYSDGLSTLSLFAQRGRLGNASMPGFRKEKVGAGAVWVRPESPERVVWGGGGRVFTLLSDAPSDAVRAAVTVLPHEKAAKTGFLARLKRGLARVGSWLNPFS